MAFIDLLNPWKKKWYRTNEWHCQKRYKNAYKIVAEYDESWDLKFFFLYKYRNKNTGEIRWRKRKRVAMFDKTIFEQPEQWIAGKSDLLIGHDIEIYDGDLYE